MPPTTATTHRAPAFCAGPEDRSQFGRMPAMVEKLVIRIGRKRVRPASRMASMADKPAAMR
jgi:hypothetical protein